MKYSILSVIILALMTFAACNTMSVTSDYDKSVDFTKFKTASYYGWADNSDKILSPFDKERLETAFGNEFRNRGLTFVKEGGDIVIALYIVTEQKQQTTATTTGMGGGYGGYGYGGYYGYGPGWGWGGGMSTTTVNTYDYTVGTLVCSVFDASEKKLIWEGTGAGEVDDNPQTRENNIPKAVARIMAQYPVPAAKTK